MIKKILLSLLVVSICFCIPALEYSPFSIGTTSQIITTDLRGFVNIITHAKIYVNPQGVTADSADIPVLANSSYSPKFEQKAGTGFGIISDSGTANIILLVE